MPSEGPVVAFIHGRGTYGRGGSAHSWLIGLNEGLVAQGLKPVPQRDALYVDYAAYLDQIAKAIGNRQSLPPKQELTAELDAQLRDDLATPPGAPEPGVPVRRCQDCRGRGLAEGIQERWQLTKGVLAHAVGDAGVKVLKDVLRYLGHAGAQEQVRQRVLDQLPADRPVLLIGHSLGSFVALDAVTRGGYQPVSLVTAGSPISVPAVRDRLPSDLRFAISRFDSPWLNVFDPGDLVTGGKWVRKGMRHGVNNWHVDNGTKHTHDAGRYLRHQPVAECVARARQSLAEG